MINPKKNCFEEIQHTADWAIRVCASSPEALFECCASGMYSLLKIKKSNNRTEIHKKIHLTGVDLESLLVSFLFELLFFYETEKAVFSKMQLRIQNNELDGELSGFLIESIQEEIKAVTYHQMKIKQIPQGLSVTVVFDV
jgi:SHS2 domain-containing protein